jgi:hypothetical protein
METIITPYDLYYTLIFFCFLHQPLNVDFNVYCVLKYWLIDWLITVSCPAQEFFTYKETSPLPVKGFKFRPMLGAQGLLSRGYLYGATPTVRWNLGFSGLIRWLVGYLLFSVPLKNVSLVWRRHHYRWRAAKFSSARCSGPLSREGSLSCHTCCDTGPRFFRLHPKDRPIQSPLTTYKGVWRTYSNADPNGSLEILKNIYD